MVSMSGLVYTVGVIWCCVGALLGVIVFLAIALFGAEDISYKIGTWMRRNRP